MLKEKLNITNSIIRITGIFEFDRINTLEKDFLDFGYVRQLIDDNSSLFHKNYWYPEFRDIFFRNENSEIASRILIKELNKKVTFLKRDLNSKAISAKNEAMIERAELFLFPNGLHFFSISLATKELDIFGISNLSNVSRNFYSEIEGYQEKLWVQWVENVVLNGVKIHSQWNEKPISVDEYSGSKFKLYTVLDLKIDDSINQETLDELLYDIGCVAPIGSARGNTNFSPSDSYFNLLMEDKITAFNNYSILPLFDTFTIIGYNVLNTYFQHITFDQTYFRIYLFNLFVKYNLYRYNKEMRQDTVKTRDKFEKFLNQYNVNPISYNFLPNLIFQKHRKTMQIEEELIKFEERINRISQSIHEEQQTRMNTLIGIVGLITSIGSVEPAIVLLENVRANIEWSLIWFYSLVFVIFIIISIPILSYLFPEKKKQILRKLRVNEYIS